jgi:hypothetical protein
MSIHIPEDTNKQIITWLLTEYTVDNDSGVPRKLIYHEYLEMCRKSSIRSVSCSIFGRYLVSVYGKLIMARLGDVYTNYYWGIRKTYYNQEIVYQFRLCSRYFNKYSQNHTSEYINNFTNSLCVREKENNTNNDDISVFLNYDAIAILCNDDHIDEPLCNNNVTALQHNDNNKCIVLPSDDYGTITSPYNDVDMSL